MLERSKGLLEWTDHKDHTGATTERSVVHLPVHAFAVGPEVDRPDTESTLVDGSPDDAHRQWDVEEFGEQGDDRDLQGKPP